jgi:DnaJ homolog subfamily C member 19
MVSLTIALLVLVGGLWMVRAFAKSTPGQAKTLQKKMIGAGLVALAGFLMLRGQTTYAIPAFAAGLGFLGYSSLFPAGVAQGQRAEGNVAPRSGPMTRDQALAILGLKADASAEDIKLTHRRLMKDLHPDKGGSDFLASQINAAKDRLLQD